jgi:hypothetical protein
MNFQLSSLPDAERPLMMRSELGACGCAAWWGTDKTQKYYQSHCHTVAGPLIAKADELPVHNRKGLGNQKEKGGGGTLKLEEAPLELFQHTVGRF